MALLYSRTT